MRFFKFKNKIKKLPFLKNFFPWFDNFDFLRYFDPSPHRQQVGSATLPQGESDDPVGLDEYFFKCRLVRPLTSSQTRKIE